MLQPRRPLAKVTLPIHSAATAGAVVLIALAGLAACPAGAQSSKAEPGAAVASRPIASKPLWRDLSSRQQRALEPLAPHWDTLTEPHKRKWLALSRNYADLSTDEQQILHSRMTAWAQLSNQERSQARFNFAEVKQVPADERKAKWEAYQALSEDEKRELASRAVPRPGAAAAIRPVPAQKLAPLPSLASDGSHTPRIQLTPPAPVVTRLPAVIPAAAPATTTASPTGAPVAAEAQVPPPSESTAEPSVSATPSVRASDQPSAAP
ncbi:DUF3106 domain-containing protein [Variovorax sp. KK3]|uniref:DUF3106 domain-containing protein n=1 Tax=Variovorax sp. KK3 TaxID=1855728 RepID=UPI0009FAF38F|nr:DUF3106 domain-containing protein [Variovorax sp. KK3]